MAVQTSVECKKEEYSTQKGGDCLDSLALGPCNIGVGSRPCSSLDLDAKAKDIG